MQSERFKVINFNAWKTDFIEDPFLAISGEITKGLSLLATDRKEFQDSVKKIVATRLLRTGLRTGLSMIPYVGKYIVQTIDDIQKEFSEKQISNYDDAISAFGSLEMSFSNIVKSLYEKSTQPLIVIVDELDRCRPSYAVKFLEIAKHFFLVDYVVYVLAINRRELSHSVKVVYGSEFDATGYLVGYQF